MDRVDSALPPIPAKRYFTIGEVSELCLVKPYVLRYWEQEFVQLKPMKRRGNRRYYQHHEVLLIRRIRELLYEQGFTISGARNRLAEFGHRSHANVSELGLDDESVDQLELDPQMDLRIGQVPEPASAAASEAVGADVDLSALQAVEPDAVLSLRQELLSIRQLLS